MVSCIACTDCENDKIRLTSHSSLPWVRTSRVRTVRTIEYDCQAIQACHGSCTDYENDKIRLTSYSSFVNVSYVACMDYDCREVDEVREEKLRRRRGCDRREREKLMKKDKQGL